MGKDYCCMFSEILDEQPVKALMVWIFTTKSSKMSM